MGIVYHGSKEHGLKKIEPRESTHGNYVYATKEKVLALHFSKRCGDDLVYNLGHFDNDANGPWELVENIPGAFEKMYSNSSSIYTISDETFKDIQSGIEEVVSEVGVNVIDEEYHENVFDGLIEAEKEGLLKIYRYPNKPNSLKEDGSYLLDKYRFYKNVLKKELTKNEFDRLVYLHPSLMEKINALAKELDYDYHYEPNDLINIFKNRIKRQISNSDNEQYIDSSYISICESFPELEEQITPLYEEYNNSINKDEKYYYHGIEPAEGSFGSIANIVVKVLNKGILTRKEARGLDSELDHVCLYKKNDDYNYDEPLALLHSARGGWIDNCFTFVINPKIDVIKSTPEETDLVDEYRCYHNISPSDIIGIALPFETIKEYLERQDEYNSEDCELLKKSLKEIEELSNRLNIPIYNSNKENFTDEIDSTLKETSKNKNI